MHMNSFSYSAYFADKILYILSSWTDLYIPTFTNPSLSSFWNVYSFSMLVTFEKFTFFSSFYFFLIRKPNINPTLAGKHHTEMDIYYEKTSLIFT